jgi:hypothetical protein
MIEHMASTVTKTSGTTAWLVARGSKRAADSEAVEDAR